MKKFIIWLNFNFKPYFNFVSEYKAIFIIVMFSFFIFSFLFRSNKKITLHFSEISQIENENSQVGSITKYLASVNDMTMKVFECYNFSIKNKLNTDKVFAAELEERMLPSFRQYNYEICDYVKIVPLYSDSLLTIFNNMNDIKSVSGKIYDDFFYIWDENHYHRYKTVVKTRQNSKGNTETYTETEYDYTDHYYYYNSKKGEQGFTSLQNISQFIGIQFPQKILVASTINAENMYAILESRDNKDSISEDFLMKNSQNYKNNSLIIYYFNSIVPRIHELNNNIPIWGKYKNTAADEHYRTYSMSHDGPTEYQASEKIKNISRNVFNLSTNLINVVTLTKKYTNELDQLIIQLIDYELNNKDGDSDLADDVLDKAVEIYELNYSDKIEYSKFDFFKIFLFLFSGFVLSNFISIFIFIRRIKSKNLKNK